MAGEDADHFIRFTDQENFDTAELCTEIDLFVCSIHRHFVRRALKGMTDSYLTWALSFVRERHIFVCPSGEHVIHDPDPAAVVDRAFRRMTTWVCSHRK